MVATIGVGYSPIDVAYDSSNGQMYVANANSNNVFVIAILVTLPTLPAANVRSN